MWNYLFKRFLQKSFQEGSITVHFSNGDTLRAGDNISDPIEVTFHDPELTKRIVLKPDMAVGEAYMSGDLTIHNDDLFGFLSLAVQNIGRNRDNMGHNPWLHRLIQNIRRLGRTISQHNPIGKAQKNVAHHYDLSDNLYDLFLDDDKQYSCAYYKTPTDSLELAQAQKKEHIAKKLCLEPGMTVLDIGCGWGGMGLTLAQDYGVNVVGVTLSQEQHKVAMKRAHDQNLTDKVDFRLQDYRHVTEKFDRIVSVGMFEHVGVPHYAEYFDHIRDFLTDDGIALIHTIGRAAPPNITSPWITKYIFPGGYVPAMSGVINKIENAGLIVADIEIWRQHYADTIRDWRERFENNIDEVRQIYDDRFCRMWRYYLVASEVTFRFDKQVVFQFQLTKKQTAAPLTRDYLY